MIPSITSTDLPALHRSADAASIAAQRRYLWSIRGNLALIVLGAVFAAYAPSDPTVHRWLATLGAATLVGGIFLTYVIRLAHHDRDWFGARAIAESAKTAAWRYMMCSEPYPSDLAAGAADAALSTQLQAILHEQQAVAEALADQHASESQITKRMRDVRASDRVARAEIYLRDRINDQQAWYASKAKGNARASRSWLTSIAAVQFVAAVVTVALVRYPTLLLEPVGILSALAAAMMAWLQVKRHQDLAHSYAMAAHELGLIAARAEHVASDQDFASFVADAENAISREHTMWIARRDTPS
jgi:hypothetical protein